MEELAPLELDIRIGPFDPQLQLVIQSCRHVLDLRNELDGVSEAAILDRYGNLLLSEEDRSAVRGYDRAFEEAKQWLYPFLLQKVNELKSLREE